MALKQRGHCPPKDEKALESGAKSEDQPDMETSRGSRCKGARHNCFFKYGIRRHCCCRIRSCYRWRGIPYQVLQPQGITDKGVRRLKSQIR